jgi:hypothetical protein
LSQSTALAMKIGNDTRNGQLLSSGSKPTHDALAQVAREDERCLRRFEDRDRPRRRARGEALHDLHVVEARVAQQRCVDFQSTIGAPRPRRSRPSLCSRRETRARCLGHAVGTMPSTR